MRVNRTILLNASRKKDSAKQFFTIISKNFVKLSIMAKKIKKQLSLNY